MRRVQKARDCARKLLDAYGMGIIPVDVKAIVEKHEQVHVVERELDSDISGALVPVETGGWVILVNAAHAPVRRRFTMAHELGHLVLHQYRTPHADRTFKFRDARSSEGSALEEIEANQFAAELLMPRDIVMQKAHDWGLDHAAGGAEDEAFIERVTELADLFKVSKQAMAIRLASLYS